MTALVFTGRRPRPSTLVDIGLGLSTTLNQETAAKNYIDVLYNSFIPNPITLTAEADADEATYLITAPDPLPLGLLQGTFTSPTAFSGGAEAVSLVESLLTLDTDSTVTGTIDLVYQPQPFPVPIVRIYFDHTVNGALVEITERAYVLHGSYLQGAVTAADPELLDFDEDDVPGVLSYTRTATYELDSYLRLVGVPRVDTAIDLR